MRHLIGGSVMGVLAVLVGGAFIVGALRRRRSRAYDQTTYRAAGGPIYLAFQLGCGGLIILGGLIIFALVALGGPPE